MKYVFIAALFMLASCTTPIVNSTDKFTLNTPVVFKNIVDTYKGPPFKMTLVLTGNSVVKQYYPPYITYDEHGKPTFHIGGIQ